tara:strand:+ start:1054 stop:2136 length:1083 start_codon:yes stop_codon:yes gene_type:complete
MSRYSRRSFVKLSGAIITTALLAACGEGTEPQSVLEPTSASGTTPPESKPVLDDSDPAKNGPFIIATTSIMGDLVKGIVGDRARLEVLMPSKTDPHLFEMSARQIAMLSEADLVVTNGLLLEEGIAPTLKQAKQDGVNVVSVGEFVDPLVAADAHDDHDKEEKHDDHDDHGEEEKHDDHAGHAHGEHDPHYWLDPRRMAKAAHYVGEQLVLVTKDSSWKASAEDYEKALLLLDSEIKQELSVIEPANRKIVSNHDSMRYFADRYEFEVLGTVIPGISTHTSPSSSSVAGLVSLIKANSIEAIFADMTEDTSIAESVVQEVGEQVKIVKLYIGSLGDQASDADTLEGLYRSNAKLIVAALR